MESTSFDQVADVVVVGAGAAGLPAAVAARDAGASVIVVEANVDIGGHGMLSGGNVPLGGGTSFQKKHGIEDSADRIYEDFTDHRNPQFRRADRDLVRMFADENAATFEFLLANGVVFKDQAPVVSPNQPGSPPRVATAEVFSPDLKVTINGRSGSGIVRPLEVSARKKGVTFLLKHRMVKIIREEPMGGRVVGIVADHDGRTVRIGARKGVILATGGHTSNVDFRRMFDPRLTEEYQVVGEPWTKQDASGEIAALEVGAMLWAVGNQTLESGHQVPRGATILMKTSLIGCRYGYTTLKWNPQSPVFPQAGASGLQVADFQDLILVNQVGRRFWNELDGSQHFLNACLGTNGNDGRGGKANGGGPIWAIFDENAVEREGWSPEPPNVDPNGYFFKANSIAELAAKITNPYQRAPITAAALEETVERWNLIVETGEDVDFGRPTPESKQKAMARRITRAPFYAAWATPMVHDSLTGLRIDTKCRVIDWHARVIPGLYCAGESAGGFALHGLPRMLVFGRVAGREAAAGAS